MKINTTWSQADWNNALKKVWKLSRDFEEILEFGLEHGFITNSDIIHASDIYRDPNKTYDEFEIEEFVKSVSLSDLMKTIQDEYSIEDIVHELDRDDVLDCFDKNDILWYLEGSYDLENHDDDVRNEYHDTLYEEIIKEVESTYDFNYKQFIKDIVEEYSPDDYHKLICDILGVGYYDKDGIKEKMKEFINKLNNNNYGIKYDNE